MAGLYIHIPFCRSRCIYCGFYSTTALGLRQDYVDALCREIELRASPSPINTIYLGGGTPSQLSIPQLHQLFDSIYIYNNVSPEAEVTIEANPDDISAEFAAELQQLPITRVSMGAQTFNDRRLHFLRRRHTAAQVTEAVNRLRSSGIHNISIDLMYGFPSETPEEWEADITQALALGVEHISTYCLTIEEGTPLHRLLQEGRISETDEETERRMYYTLIDRLEAAGYEHYEISNFAKPVFRSRHNSSYWNLTPYIGLGAAAHSFDGHNCRRWNIADIRQYIKGIENGQPNFEQELLDENTRYNDMLTVTLRTNEGLDLNKLSDYYSDYCLREAKHYIEDGLLRLRNGHLSLTKAGLFVSDMIISSLMYI
jgi:oxygen-independent coproporphyrinogen-3 oxidase